MDNRGMRISLEIPFWENKMVPSNSRNYLSEKEKDWTQIKDFLILP